MSFTLPIGRPSVLVTSPNSSDHRRQIAQGVNRAMQGHINCTLFVTLDPNVSSTTVTDTRVSTQTHVGLMPQTANAAAELAAGTLTINCTNGAFTITHANNGQTDRTFTASMIG